MNILILSIRFFLAILLAVAGVSKLSDPAGSRKAMLAFGLPKWSAPILAWLVPIAELLLALALLPAFSALPAAAGATVLFLVFSVGVGYNFARGNTASCACFGRLAPAPIGATTVVRNVALTLASAFLVWSQWNGTTASLIGWIGELSLGERVYLVVGVITIGLLGVATYLLLRLVAQQNRLLTLVDEKASPSALPTKVGLSPSKGLPIGAPAPAFTLPDSQGTPVSLAELLSAVPLLLAFVAPGCGPCDDMLTQMEKWAFRYSKRIRTAAISSGSQVDPRVDHFLFDQGDSVSKAYNANWLPSAVLLSPDGRIASRVASGFEAIEALALHAANPENLEPWLGANLEHMLDPLEPLPFGSAAPDFQATDLGGSQLSLSEYHGRMILLVFLSTGCPYCIEVTADLRAYEESAGRGSTEMLIVFDGSADDVRRLGLRSRCVLSTNGEISALYRVESLPAAILIDANGRTGSLLESTSVNILPLLGVRPHAHAD